jgi:hypothetical protein
MDLSVAAHKNKRIIFQRKFEEWEECCVCLNEMCNYAVQHLPCKHKFHHNCLKGLIENAIYTCPMCRRDNIKEYLFCGLISKEVMDRQEKERREFEERENDLLFDIIIVRYYLPYIYDDEDDVE